MEYPNYAMSQDAVAAEQQRFMVKVYNWMTAGLAVTGGMAFYVSHNETILSLLIENQILFFHAYYRTTWTSVLSCGMGTKYVC